MFNFSRGLYCILVGYSIFISMAAHSAVTLDRTRIIFPGTELILLFLMIILKKLISHKVG